MTNAVSGVPVTLLAQFVLNGASAAPELPITLTITPVAEDGTPTLTPPSARSQRRRCGPRTAP